MRSKTTKVIAALLSAAITVSSLVSAAPANDVIIAEASQGTTSTEDKFSDTIYSMPGPLAISFPPVDSGENHDSRVTDIVTELWNGLDDSNIATYNAYSGDVNISFQRRYIDDDGKEHGTYDSLGDIVSMSNSLDTTFEYMKNTKDFDPSTKVYISNTDFHYFSQRMVNTSAIRKLIYGFTKSDDNRVNLATALGWWYASPKYNCDTFGGHNETIISIVKDDYYYLDINPINRKSYDTYSTKMWGHNYYENHSKDYISYIHYIIDLRPEYDYRLSRICSESYGKYIQYTPENLKKLIRLINERRAFDDRVSPTPPPYDPTPNPSTTTTEDPTPGSDKDPIVLIPGIMGSQLYSNENGKEDLIWPGMGEIFSFDLGNSMKITKSLYVKNYDNGNGKPINQNALDEDNREKGPRDSLKNLVNKICEEFPDREVYVFNYDWRKSNRESALKLEEFIDNISADKVDIVAHSMGGLVTSLYIASQGKDKFDKVDKIITVGTPYEGAPHVFDAIEYGSIIGFFEDILLGMGGISRNVLIGFPGVCELIPSLTYCSKYPMSFRENIKDLDNDYTLDADGYRSMIDDELGEDNSFFAFSLQQAIHSYKPNSYSTSDCNILLTYDNSYFIMGQNICTPRDFTLYKDKNKYDIVGFHATSGDGTVPTFSAEMAGMINTYKMNHQYMFEEKHVDLIKKNDPLDCICKILNNEKPDAPHYIKPDSFTEIQLHCPVDVEIGTGDDRLCSAADDLSLTSSFGSLYIFGENNDEKFICMKTGTNLDIKITGTDTGTMDFSVRHYSGEDELLDESYFEDVPITDSTFINTNADSGEETVLCIDKDGDDVVDETWTAQKGETVTVPDETINIIKPIKKNILYGDVNFDGVVNISDAVAILRYVSSPEKYPLNKQALEAANVCDNGTSGINSEDARVIMMIDSRLLSQDKLPVKSKDLK
ncbi:MAG: alpha/beta hydrolase [Ruminococcus sp.]|uniref:lipase/acyltransferase domain-containing protein n=1 Tax=Ruminococcus sp. TaxID=41978 RepID=UPI0025FC0CC0|nr:alpha/beta hydrolase [Ruminococcus sp.]MBO4866755.1 alpha/beta hydrolase [Ruminococcus sp.]